MSVFASLGRFVVKFRWIIIVLWIAAIPLTSHFLPSLSSVTQSENSSFLPSNSPFTDALNLAKPFFQGSDPSGALTVVASTNTPFTKADRDAIAQATTALSKLPNIKSARQEAISKDNEAEEINVETTLVTTGPTDVTKAKTTVDDVRNYLASLSKPDSLTFHTTGTLAQAVDSNAQSDTQRSGATGYSIIFILILLLLVFRGVLAPLVTLIPAVVSLTIAGPVIAESTKTGLQISSITQLLLIVLILGAGTDYGLFLIFRVREELRRGLTPSDAVVHALSRVGESITFSAATVIAALVSLLLATFGLYRGLGPGLAIGLAIMLLAALTLLPALLAVFGRATFWPSKTFAQEQKAGVWGRFANSVIKRPVVMLIIGVVLLGGLSIGVLGFKVGGFGDTSSLPAGSDSAQAETAVSAHFPAATTGAQTLLIKFPRSVWADPAQLQTVADRLNANKTFTSLVGPLNPGGVTISAADLVSMRTTLGPASSLAFVPKGHISVTLAQYEAYIAASNFISSDGQTIMFHGLLAAGASGSSAAEKAIPTVRTALADAAPGAQTGVLSADSASYDVDAAASSDLEHIIPLVLLVIAVLLAILLRSLIAPLYLIATVGLSYLAGLGFAMIVFVYLKGDSGLIFILPFLMFIFSMALGEDYNILVMTRIREEAHEAETLPQAVTKAMSVTGTTVTSAGLILAGTFGVLAVVAGGGGSDEVQQIGLSIAFGILLDTFFVRTLLVPSVVVLLDHWNWWPSDLSLKHRERTAKRQAAK